MIRIRQGTVSAIIENRTDMQIVEVFVEGEKTRAIHFPQISGEIITDQRVILNTTARHLGLGTGGYDFVIHAEGNEYYDPDEFGHIIKLRYTPFQLKVLSVEEEVSKYHQKLKTNHTLEGMPVIAAPVHSMVAAIVVVIKKLEPKAKIAYLMSDGGALPLSFSNLINALRKKNWLDGTITFGHAFGGDYEAVNIYSALLAARWVVNADIAIIAMGPGIVGTNTPYGFTGAEQANFLHAIKVLEGIPIAVPRISFADDRSRHWGISHHTLTVLGKLTLIKSHVPLPTLPVEKEDIIRKQLDKWNLAEKHHLWYNSTSIVQDILKNTDIELRTMGRDFHQDREFFLTAGLAGILALEKKP